MFFSAFFFAVVTIVYFTVGMVAQRTVCETFRNVNDSDILKLVDNLVDLNKSAGVDAKIGEILTNCHQNQSIYNVLKLKNIFDINKVNDYLSEFNINQTLNELVETVKVDFTSFEILDNTTIKELEKLKDAGIDDVEFYRFSNVVSHI